MRGAGRNTGCLGTPEETWRAWPALGSLPVWAPAGAAGGDRGAVLVAAHPEDEVLGFGGSTAGLAAAGVALRLVLVTDGEGAGHAGTDEARRALAELGASDAELVRLRVPDGAVVEHESAVAGRIAVLLDGFDLCVAPWEGDEQPDHEAVGRAARAACAGIGTREVRYPLHMWHWAEPDDPRVPWEDAARVHLDGAAAARKRAALDCFGALRREDVEHFLRPDEVVLR